MIVNRLWLHHFGEGLVPTPSNFGKLGEAPTHPALLDWLALEFMERGWSLKQMHRLMLMSQAYQMRSDDIAANVALDPENRLFWRRPRLRLEAEIIRDAMLAVAGNLNPLLGGCWAGVGRVLGGPSPPPISRASSIPKRCNTTASRSRITLGRIPRWADFMRKTVGASAAA